jgi:hypothetical protein
MLIDAFNINPVLSYSIKLKKQVILNFAGQSPACFGLTKAACVCIIEFPEIRRELKLQARMYKGVLYFF